MGVFASRARDKVHFTTSSSLGPLASTRGSATAAASLDTFTTPKAFRSLLKTVKTYNDLVVWLSTTLAAGDLCWPLYGSDDEYSLGSDSTGGTNGKAMGAFVRASRILTTGSQEGLTTEFTRVKDNAQMWAHQMGGGRLLEKWRALGIADDNVGYQECQLEYVDLLGPVDAIDALIAYNDSLGNDGPPIQILIEGHPRMESGKYNLFTRAVRPGRARVPVTWYNLSDMSSGEVFRSEESAHYGETSSLGPTAGTWAGPLDKYDDRVEAFIESFRDSVTEADSDCGTASDALVDDLEELQPTLAAIAIVATMTGQNLVLDFLASAVTAGVFSRLGGGGGRGGPKRQGSGRRVLPKRRASPKRQTFKSRTSGRRASRQAPRRASPKRRVSRRVSPKRKSPARR